MSSALEKIRFIGQWISAPLKTGAITPSSKALAHAMVDEIPHHEGPIIELGPGTGVMTEVMIERGIKPEQIYAIEYSEDFAEKLRKNFPAVNIIHGDAYKMDALIGDALKDNPAIATMCSLPLFTQSLEQRQSLFEQSKALSEKGAPFILFSYAHKSPIPCPEGYKLVKSPWVKKNIPPARAWTYKAAS